MTLGRDTVRLAYARELPGTRCDPEDAGWPCAYTLLAEAELARELAVVANAESTVFDAARGWRADSVNFQPCPYTKTQDRSVVRQLDIHGRRWTLTAIFDGHLGHDTVDHTAHHLPIIIEDFLRKSLPPAHTTAPPRTVAEILCRAITSFDEAIAADVLDLFPCGVEDLAKLPDRLVSQIVNDGGDNYFKTRLCMYGTTALVALVDPAHENLCVANLGDCQAVLVSTDAAGRPRPELLTARHNGDNDDEIARVQREHPGESECVSDGRVLGVMAPTRCIGDIPFKQPAAFTRKILYNLAPGYHDSSPWEEFLERNHTPPYISAQAEVAHRALGPGAGARHLILCSDGLTDICAGMADEAMVAHWARGLGLGGVGGPGRGARAKDAALGAEGNLAVRLLRHVLGGDDAVRVSRVLTLDHDLPWIDDTSIVVQSL